MTIIFIYSGIYIKSYFKELSKKHTMVLTGCHESMLKIKYHGTLIYGTEIPAPRYLHGTSRIPCSPQKYVTLWYFLCFFVSLEYHVNSIYYYIYWYFPDTPMKLQEYCYLFFKWGYCGTE